MISQEDILVVLRELVVDAAKANPAYAPELIAFRARVEATLGAESPLAELGWDSVQMTWVLVRLEERFEIDTSSLSLFEIFTVGDLLRELKRLIDQKPSHG